ncbi:hypothetical protein SUDANB95_02046 [Actinosynnema sp. ALI-1.44]
MKGSSLRRVVVAAVAATAALVSLAPSASASPDTTGSASFTGDPGDWVTQGLSYKYNTDAGDSLRATGSENNNYVRVNIDGANGDWWSVEFAAPQGQQLTVGGKATITGTVDCSAPVRIHLSGRVTQVKNDVLIRGDYATAVDCVPGAGTPWTAVADPTGTTPFQRGLVEVTTHGYAIDPHYGNAVEIDKTTVVRLERAAA